MTVLILHQRLDKLRLQQIRCLSELTPQEEKLVEDLLKECVRTRIKVNYKANPDNPQGRINGRGSIGNAPGWIARLVAGEIYSFLDIENAAVTILVQLAHRHSVVVPSLLRQFATREGRGLLTERLLAQLNSDDPKFAKKSFNAVLNGHSIEELYCPLMLEWREACRSFVHGLKSCQAFADVWQLTEKKETNRDATFVSYLYQRYERKCMLAACQFLEQKGYRVGVWKHDGLWVETVFTPEVVADITEHIFKQTELHVSLHYGRPLPTKQDLEIYYGPKNLSMLPNDEERCRHLLAIAGQKGKHLRFGGNVLVPHGTIPGVYEQQGNFREYINRTLANETCFILGNANLDKLEKWFESVTHPFFPLRTASEMRSDWISFRTTTFNTSTVTLHPYSELKEAPFTDHFYDTEVLQTERATPLWDKLIKTQLSDSMYDTFEILLGRLQFPVGRYDNWQVMPFMQGDAGTGKGTVIQVLRAMKPRGKVGAITSNTERGFGLSALFNKELIVVPDLPTNFASVVEQSMMQSIVSGESVSVATKNKTASSEHVWTVPIIIAANYIFNYRDNQGQWKRRVALFFFNNKIKKSQSDLAERIIAEELPYIAMRCIKKYRSAVNSRPGADFWQDIAPEELVRNQKYVESHTNVLARFINEGSNDFGVVRDEGHVTKWTEFSAAFGKYLKEDLRQFHTRVDDIGDTALRRAGYEVFRAQLRQNSEKKDGRINYCQFCPRQAEELGHECDLSCEQHICYYNKCKKHTGSKRGKTYGILHMRLVPRAEYDRRINSNNDNEVEVEQLEEEADEEKLTQKLIDLQARQADRKEIARTVRRLLKENAKRVRQIVGQKRKTAPPGGGRGLPPVEPCLTPFGFKRLKRTETESTPPGPGI